MDECTAGTHLCGDEGGCENVGGGYVCTSCAHGKVLRKDGLSCGGKVVVGFVLF